MKLFSDCSGECCLCACGGGCLAGHGDDDFSPASKEQIIGRLDRGEYKSYTQMMKDHLKNHFGYDYDAHKIETVTLSSPLNLIVYCFSNHKMHYLFNAACDVLKDCDGLKCDRTRLDIHMRGIIYIRFMRSDNTLLQRTAGIRPIKFVSEWDFEETLRKMKEKKDESSNQ